MFLRSLRLTALVVLAAFLSACTIVVVPFEPDVEASVTAATDPVLITTRTIEAGETMYFEVTVPTPRDLLYGEADGSGLRVSWISQVGSRLAVSRTPVYYVGSLFDLPLVGSGAGVGEEDVGAAAVERASIVPDPVGASCFGPCVAVRPASSRYFLEVRNESPSAKTFGLYVYTVRAGDAQDRGTNRNDTRSSATPIAWGETRYGAIELVGDVDWFHYTGSVARTLFFQVDDARLDLVLTFDNAEFVGTTGGFTTNVYPGERFRVSSRSGRAGPSSSSGYVLEVR